MGSTCSLIAEWTRNAKYIRKRLPVRPGDTSIRLQDPAFEDRQQSNTDPEDMLGLHSKLCSHAGFKSYNLSFNPALDRHCQCAELFPDSRGTEMNRTL